MNDPRLTAKADQAWEFAKRFADRMEPLAKKLMAGEKLTVEERMLAASCLMNVLGEVRKRQFEAGDES